MGSPWLSWLLLLLAYITFGQFLHESGADTSLYGWVIGVVFAIALAAIMTIFWKPSQKILLLGFKSDAGYSIMVLGLASLAVVAVVELRFFSYILMLVAASLLARVDTLLIAVNTQVAFLILTFLPLLGLALSWLPLLLLPSGHGEQAAFLSL